MKDPEHPFLTQLSKSHVRIGQVDAVEGFVNALAPGCWEFTAEGTSMELIRLVGGSAGEVILYSNSDTGGPFLRISGKFQIPYCDCPRPSLGLKRNGTPTLVIGELFVFEAVKVSCKRS